MEIVLQDLEATKVFAERIVQEALSIPHPDSAYLIALSGELGAGKTTFVQSFARTLGITETIQSPTFVLMKFYYTNLSWPKRIVHIDAYRLEGFSALQPLGWEEIVKNKDTLILLEWPECVAPLVPDPDRTITLSVLESGGRQALLS